MKELDILNIKEVDECDVWDITNNESDLYENEGNFLVNDTIIHNCGKHAGGVLILDKPVYECLPVISPKGEISSAFVESSSSTDLDELGFVKYDLLAISQLDTIDSALDLAEKDGFFKIIDDDGITKIVSKAYLLEKGLSEEEINEIKDI